MTNSTKIYIICLILLIFFTQNLFAKEIGFLTVNVNEEKVYIKVNNKLKAKRSPAEIKLKPGEYEIKIKKSGYKVFTKNINIKTDQVTKIDINLKKLEFKKQGWLKLDSNQKDAVVTLNGKLKANSLPQELSLKSGRYKIGIAKNGFRKVKKFIKVFPGEVTNKNIYLIDKNERKLIRKKIGKLKLNFDNKFYEYTNININAGKKLKFQSNENKLEKNLSPKNYLVKITKKNYYPQKLKIKINPFEITEKNIKLKRFGLLELTTEDEYTVKLNNKIQKPNSFRRYTLFMEQNKKKKYHTLTISKRGYKTYKEKFKLFPDEVVTKSIYLEKKLTVSNKKNKKRSRSFIKMPSLNFKKLFKKPLVTIGVIGLIYVATKNDDDDDNTSSVTVTW